MSQEPSTKESTSNKDVSKKRSLGVLGQDEVSSAQFGTTTCLSGRQRSRGYTSVTKMLHLAFIL